MYATVAAAAALHQVLLRSLGEDKVVVQNVASGLFCVLFVALGVAGRPTLLATSMLGYLISDSTSVTTAGYALHHAVTAMLLLVSLRGNGAYDDLTVVLGGYGEASTVLLCVADTFKQRPRLQKAYPRANRAVRYAFALAFLVLRVGYWSAWILEKGKDGSLYTVASPPRLEKTCAPDHWLICAQASLTGRRRLQREVQG